MTLLVRILSYPFIVLGFVWQFAAGSFYAGRLLSTGWIAKLAANNIRASLAKAGVTLPTTDSRTGRGLH